MKYMEQQEGVMTQQDIIQTILKDTNYRLNLFKGYEINTLCPKPKEDDYPIFFAVSEKGGKDNSGDYVYAKKDSGDYKLDKNRHPIIDHDLHNHDGELPDGIAEAFIEWATNEGMSFCL